MTRALDDSAKMSVKPLWSPCMWVKDTRGDEALAAICASSGLDPRRILDASQWVELERAVAFLARVRELTSGEPEFLRVCAHRMREGYGPILLVLPVATPRLMFRAMARTVPLFSNTSRCEVHEESRTRLVLRFESDAPELETRELCLTRVAATTEIPSLFGLPPALLTERSCMARGDPYCEYECRFYTRNRWLPTAVAAGVGGATAYGLGLAGVDPSLGWASLPIVFGLLGAIWELRRTSSVNVEHGLAIQGALEELALHEGEARREIVAFHQRQKEWGKLMEEQVSERTAQLEMLMDRLRTLGEDRVTTVRGVSHDLRNPMQVLRGNQALLRRAIARSETKAADGLLDDNEEVIDQMETLLRELSVSARSDRGLVPVNPAPMKIEPWVDTLRKRVKALAFGKDLSVSVFRTREAPEEIVTDRLIFERIADNLCSNAAKYTERGSIVIELDGKPGFLTLKVSDTGLGIEPERIEGIFEPGGPDKRVAQSLGVGLSVVAQLMAQIGGRIEVMSKVERGTTFWAHFPVEPPAPPPETRRDEPPAPLADVVTIRRSLSA